MMNGRPNDPEYCQNIYEAAKKASEFYTFRNITALGTVGFLVQMDVLMGNLKRALEGKENV